MSRKVTPGPTIAAMIRCGESELDARRILDDQARLRATFDRAQAYVDHLIATGVLATGNGLGPAEVAHELVEADPEMAKRFESFKARLVANDRALKTHLDDDVYRMLEDQILTAYVLGLAVGQRVALWQSKGGAR